MISKVSITAIHTATKAVVVLQGITSLSQTDSTLTVTIAGLTITLDRTAWTIITNAIAAPITGE